MKIIDLVHFDVTDSTQDEAKNPKYTRPKMPGDCVLFEADEQTKGRGTHGRQWASPPKVNIYATYAFLPSTDRNIEANILQVTAFSVIEVLREYGFAPTYKWPNDVLLEGKKTCGIMCECGRLEGDRDLRYLGVGLNVNMEANELSKAEYVPMLRELITSMKMASGVTYNKQEVFDKLNDRLMHNLKLLYTEGFDTFYKKISPVFEKFNGELRWFDIKDQPNDNEYIKAKVIGMTPEGFIRLQREDGSELIPPAGRLLKDSEITKAESAMGFGAAVGPGLLSQPTQRGGDEKTDFSLKYL